jgi:hypothetical protein
MSIQEKKIPVKLPKIRKDNLSNINKVNTYIICIDQWFNSENAARIFSERIVQSDQNIKSKKPLMLTYKVQRGDLSGK